MFKKRLKRPLFFRKSKKAKEGRPHRNVHPVSDTSLIENDRELGHNRSPYRKNRQRYNREYSENYRSPRRKNKKSKQAKEAKPNHNVDPPSDTSFIENGREFEHYRSPRRKNKKIKKEKETKPNHNFDPPSDTSFIENDRELEYYRSSRRKNEKSKKAKETEPNYNVDSASDISLIEHHIESEHYRSPRVKNRQTYNKEYSEYYRSPNRRNRQRYYREYSDEEQYYDDREYYYDFRNQNMYNSDDGMFEYTADGNQYYRSPRSDISYFEESDSDCEFCNKNRKNRNRKSYDDSEYTYNKHQPKRRHARRRPPDMSETERPYGRDYDVYIAHQPIEHHAFQNKQQDEQIRRSSDTNVNTNETVEDESTETDMIASGLQYQVYAAGTEQNQSGAFQSQPRAMSHERLIEITEYNRNIPIIGLKDKSKNHYENRSPSDIVYLPVIVLNETISLPKTKVISYETLANKAGANVDRLLEKNIHLFAASHIDHHNKYARVNNGAKERNLEPLLNHNINIYAASLQHTNPFKKNKSTSSISHNKSLLGKTNLLPSEQATQKSFISDAPTKLRDGKTITGKNPNSPKRSRSNISSRSLIGSSRSGSPKGAGFFSKIHIQDLKARRERKKGLKSLGVSSDAAVGSSLHPPYQVLEDNVDQDQEIITKHDFSVQDESGVTDNKPEQSIIAGTGEPQGTAEQSIFEESKVASVIDEKSPSEIRRTGLYTVGGESKGLPTDEHGPFLRKEIKDENQVENDNQKYTLKSTSTVLLEGENFSKPTGKQMQINESSLTVPQKKTFTSRWFRKKKDPLIGSLGPKEYVHNLEIGNTTEGILENYNQKSFKKTTQSSPGTTITQIDDGMSRLQRQGSQKIYTSIQSDNVLDQKDVDVNLEQMEDPIDKRPDSDDYQSLTVMEYKLIPSLIHAFLAAQVFLGLSLHSTVLKIVRTLSDDQT